MNALHEESLVQSCRRLLVEHATDVLTVADIRGMVAYQSPSVEGLLGYREIDTRGKSVFAPVHPQDLRLAIGTFGRTVQDPSQSHRVELRYRHRDGSWRILEVMGKSVTDEQEVSRVLLYSRDITGRKRVEEAWQYLATHDELTGLLNRRRFMELLAAAVRSAKRYGYPLTVCLCDMDFFKLVNDQYGHLMGNDVLASWGRLVAKSLRAEDFAGRFGGDEFCIVFPHTAAAEAGVGLNRLIRQLKETTFRTESGHAFSLTVSCGVSEAASEDVTERDVLIKADRALYQAKRDGRNRLVVYGQESISI